MFVTNWKKEIFTVPNMLSLFRILLIPVYVTMYLRADETGDFFLAGGVLALSCMTDWVDGKIARQFGMISKVGKVLDPVADKATQFALILCLAVRYPAVSWLVVPFLGKECFQLIAGTIALKKGLMLDGALFAGKICTVVLFISFIFLAMFPNLPNGVVMGITGLDSFFIIVSFLAYFFAYFGKKKKLRPI